MIHHITARDNVIDGKVVDPSMVKHGIVTAMKISESVRMGRSNDPS